MGEVFTVLSCVVVTSEVNTINNRATKATHPIHAINFINRISSFELGIFLILVIGQS
jgi:hypothetical protein